MEPPDDNIEMTSSPDGKITYKKGKVIERHDCIQVDKINEIHDTLFDKEKGLITEVSLINDRQQKALKVLEKIEKQLECISSDLAQKAGEKLGKEIAKKEEKIEETLRATRRRDKLWRIGTFIAALVGIGTILTMIYKMFQYFSK